MTDKEYEEAIDKMCEELDQQQSLMEGFGFIVCGDIAYYLRTPEEYEKDKKICELESKIERLEYLLKVSDKALELACENAYWYVLEYYIGSERPTKEEYIKKQTKRFIKEAKEKMKSE